LCQPRPLPFGGVCPPLLNRGPPVHNKAPAGTGYFYFAQNVRNSQSLAPALFSPLAKVPHCIFGDPCRSLLSDRCFLFSCLLSPFSRTPLIFFTSRSSSSGPGCRTQPLAHPRTRLFPPHSFPKTSSTQFLYHSQGPLKMSPSGSSKTEFPSLSF